MRKLLAYVVLFLMLPAVAMAENSTKIPGFTIHHNVITTDFLAPNIATAYRIIRSPNRAMLNVSVIRDVENTTGQASMAQISARAVNLMGQSIIIPLREIREGEAIYYIGDFIIPSGNQKLIFMLDVQPDGADKPYTAKLEHDFNQ